jgi:hypothetical protein
VHLTQEIYDEQMEMRQVSFSEFISLHLQFNIPPIFLLSVSTLEVYDMLDRPACYHHLSSAGLSAMTLFILEISDNG